jgi:glycosyltransferase involved in cell wall biosynthesis
MALEKLAAPLRLAVDATPLLGARTGVGRYVAGLVEGLAALPDPPQLTLAAFTARGARAVPHLGGAAVAGRPFPARLLQALWARSAFPPVEWLAGPCDVFHATNFVLPPTRRAVGVLTVHDLAFALHPDTVTDAVLRYRHLVPAGAKRAAVVITPTQAVADEVAQWCAIPRDKVLVARSGVDPAWAAATKPDTAWLRAHRLPERYLLFVGTVEPRKNLSVLLAAVRALHHEPGREVPPLVLAGPAGWGTPLDTGGLPEGAIVRAGYLEEHVLHRVVAGAAALAFPSRYEGFGLPPLEALACGTPVIASDLPVLREVTGDQARYVPVGDIDALAGALGAVLDDDGGVAARTARRAYAASWTWRRCAEETYAAYRRAQLG